MHKYYAQLFKQPLSGQTYGFWDPNREWHHHFFCREFVVREVGQEASRFIYADHLTTIRVMGGSMRKRTKKEQEGMAKFAAILLPNYVTMVDSLSIWVEPIVNNLGYFTYPSKATWSMLLFYIKYMAINMQDNVTFDRVCKHLARRKHYCFEYLPDQQLGTAFYFYAYASHQPQMVHFEALLDKGNGPGTAMTQLAHLQDDGTKMQTEARNFYYTTLDEWCSLYKKDLRYRLNQHVESYERKWYLPLLMQDVYDRVYDGDGKFDNIEYGENEW
jgi:hypothetical protein